ncbi:recombinase family protein [Akkermansiaceae bacterium]|nr:recombinase family protein [Akkermansiaceae bacterium]
MAKLIPAIAYLRVSGRSQIDGDGYTRQEEKIRTWAKRNRYEIVSVFKEEAISGASELSERPALSELMLKIAGNGVRTCLVENTSRFSRDLIASELLIREFHRMGARVIECEGGYDISESEDPTAKMVRQILGAVGEFEKNSIVLKLRTARKRMKAEMGRCEGRKPYGDREGEAEVIALMKSLRRKRPNQKRMSYDRIAKALEEKGIKTRSGSSDWKSNTIRRILSR